MKRVNYNGTCPTCGCNRMAKVKVKKGPFTVPRFQCTQCNEILGDPLLVAPKAGTSAMICPHCGTKGTVITQQVKMKAGVSGGKATGAVLTGGVSLLATGLSRKQKVTEAHCSACGARWTF